MSFHSGIEIQPCRMQILSANSILHAFLQGLDFNYLVCCCRLLVPRRVWGCDPSTEKRAICRVIASPLQGSNGADESCCIYTPEYVHTTGKRPKKTPIFIIFCKGGFSGNLEGFSLKISPGVKPSDLHFLSSSVSYHSA